MITLTPSPRSLGLHSPVLGPWFSADTVQLGLPDPDLAVPLTLDGDVEWRPPAAGILSFYVASDPRPLGLAPLRGPDGLAFTEGRLVATYELLPQASERLGALMRAVPTLGTPTVANRATRPIVRTLALEIVDAVADVTWFDGRLPFPFPATVDTDEKKRTYLGLASDSGALANGASPMRDPFRPGVTGGESQFLLKFPSSTQVRLWAFDQRGHAVDPGAAACWWLYLATHADNGFEELFADGVDSRTAPIASGADRLTVQLVNAFGGALSAEELARVAVSGNASGSGANRFRGSGSGAVDLAFTDAPTDAPDDLPVPRLAVLPDGRFGETASLFPDGPVDPILRRDHARVAVLSIEHHLTGQPRHADGGAPAPVRRRAADQERATTRQLVDRATHPCLLRTADDVATAALDALRLQDGGAAVPSRMAASALTLDWGPLGGALANVPVPATITVGATALTGGGTEAGGTVAGQRVLFTVELGTAAAGAWVRCWTQGFDHTTGTRYHLDGGAGLADATGVARVVAPLADGDAAPETPMGVSVLVVTAQGQRFFADQRFDRPAPVGGSAASAASASGPFLLCEEGREVASLGAGANIASGTHVVALGGGSTTLVEPATITAAMRAPATFAAAASANLTLRLTPPAFKGAPAGDADAPLAATGATVRRTARTLPNAWAAGQPFPGLERRELVVAATAAGASRAAVGGGPALGDRHGLLPHHNGHPLCPAGPDVIAVGARVDGPAVRGLAEYVRDRVATSTIDLVTTVEAGDLAVPSAPAADSLWVAGLRTVAAGMEAEVGLSQLAALVGGSGYPFGEGLASIRSALSGTGITIPAGISDSADRIARALDRRFLAAAHGAREGATALVRAIERAEDFIYLETPALDDLAFGETDDRLHLLDTLFTRMTERPGLRVLACVPVFFDADIPKAYQRIRDQVTRAALDRLGAETRAARVAVISPSAGPARTLKLATTAVIVDDAWAMVGTTHLWRRGLSFDSSFAVSVFDDRLENGRPQEILAFRRQLCADRLGVSLAEVPDDPADLVAAARALVARGGFGRLAAERLRPPVPEATTAAGAFTEVDVWNPDGSASASLNLASAAFGLLPTAVTEALATP
jgi:hypothetical protein